jgi:putative serine protease PepD
MTDFNQQDAESRGTLPSALLGSGRQDVSEEAEGQEPVLPPSSEVAEVAETAAAVVDKTSVALIEPTAAPIEPPSASAAQTNLPAESPSASVASTGLPIEQAGALTKPTEPVSASAAPLESAVAAIDPTAAAASLAPSVQAATQAATQPAAQAPPPTQAWTPPQQSYQPHPTPQQYQPYQAQQPYQQTQQQAYPQQAHQHYQVQNPYAAQQPTAQRAVPSQYQHTIPGGTQPAAVQGSAAYPAGNAAAQHTTSAQHAATPGAASHQHTAASAQASKSSAPSKGSAFFVTGLVGVLIGAAVSFGVLFLVSNNLFSSSSQDSVQITDSGQITINPSAEDVTLAEAVSAKVLPSVVNIDVYAASGGGLYDDFDSSGSGSLEEYGLGSGVVISEDGYILTNDHVVEGGTEFMVRLDQNTQLKATLKGRDVTSDLAVLKVEASGLKPIELADSSEVNVGEWVMALGSPFGLEKSVSTGIVSALFRSTTMESQAGTNVYANMIQTDAAINPGNSGGALVNAEGKLIGINTLISSSSGTSAGVGFAIPSNYAMNIAQQIMDGKEVEHGFLGVQLRTVDSGNALNLNSNVQTGAYISKVVAGSPAEKAGLKEGDIITKLDGSSIASGAELVISVRVHLVGDKINLEVQRGSETMDVEVTLGSSDTD